MNRHLLPYGDHAVLLECPDLADVLGLAPLITAEQFPVSEVIPGARTLLLRLDRPLVDHERQRLLTMTPQHQAITTADPVMIMVTYDGDDLEFVAQQTNLSVPEVIAAHTSQVWTVAFCGFAPGFGYLIGEHDQLRVPRRDSPRQRVPAGAVALADHWSAIYPRSGPGGWQLIGRTDHPLWDLSADPPAALQPGTRVHFRDQHRMINTSS